MLYQWCSCLLCSLENYKHTNIFSDNAFLFCWLLTILGDPGAVSRVGINGGESFQERAREPLGCYSWRTSSTTHWNACVWLFFVPYRKPEKVWNCCMLSKCMGLNGNLTKRKMHAPTEEFRLWTDRRWIRKHQSSSRLVHATLQVYSLSFVRSSCVTEEKCLTTNLQTLKDKGFSPAHQAHAWQVCLAGVKSHAHKFAPKRVDNFNRYAKLY